MTSTARSGPQAMDALLTVLRFAPVRLALLTGIMFYMYISGHLFRATYAKGAAENLGVVLWMIAATLVVYAAFARLVERRAVGELAVAGMGRELGLGLVLGAGTYTACVAVLMAFGAYRIEGFNSPMVLLAVLWFAVSSGFFEELFFRGVLMRITTEVLGSWAGLAVSSLAFGLVHLNNPGATWQGVLFISVEAGILLGAAYMLTGRLWLGMGWHMAWNYTQSGVFSGINSGNEPSNGWIRAEVAGPDLLTGGIFGMEASLVAFLLCTATGIVMLVMAVQRGRVVAPVWRREAAPG